MRPITLCMAYYRNPSMLMRHYGLWERMAAYIRAGLEVIIVDDGSPFPDEAPTPPASLQKIVSIYRMMVDVRWNQDACRNLAVDRAETEWLILTDMDHLAPEGLLSAAMNGKLDTKCAYNFPRVSEPESRPTSLIRIPGSLPRISILPPADTTSGTPDSMDGRHVPKPRSQHRRGPAAPAAADTRSPRRDARRLDDPLSAQAARGRRRHPPRQPRDHRQRRPDRPIG